MHTKKAAALHTLARFPDSNSAGILSTRSLMLEFGNPASVRAFFCIPLDTLSCLNNVLSNDQVIMHRGRWENGGAWPIFFEKTERFHIESNFWPDNIFNAFPGKVCVLSGNHLRRIKLGLGKAFSIGLTFVALSRVRTSDGICHHDCW